MGVFDFIIVLLFKKISQGSVNPVSIEEMPFIFVKLSNKEKSEFCGLRKQETVLMYVPPPPPLNLE